LRSIADGKTLADMGRTLDFVGHGDGVVLKGDPALAVGRGQELVGSEMELAGPLALDEQGGGRQEGPVRGSPPSSASYLAGKFGLVTSRT
jgi:hypothetical protein